MKKTYYFDNSVNVYEKRLVVVTEQQFRKIQNNHLAECSHHWINGDFNNIEEAKEYFRTEWMH